MHLVSVHMDIATTKRKARGTFTRALAVFPRHLPPLALSRSGSTVVPGLTGPLSSPPRAPVVLPIVVFFLSRPPGFVNYPTRFPNPRSFENRLFQCLSAARHRCEGRPRTRGTPHLDRGRGRRKAPRGFPGPDTSVDLHGEAQKAQIQEEFASSGTYAPDKLQTACRGRSLDKRKSSHVQERRSQVR